MSAPLRAVLFDLDGTLLDTAPDFAYVVNTLLQRHGRPQQAYAQLRQSVSDGARGMVMTAFHCRDTDPEFEPLRRELLALYAVHLADNTRLFPGMDDVLAFLEERRLPWGIVTNKPSTYAAPLLRALQLDARCATLVCPDHVQHRKPHPEPLQLACRHIGCGAEHSIYIGDHRRDIEAGRNAGMPTVACAFGYVNADDPCSAWEADYIAQLPGDIIPIIEERLAP